MQSAKAVQFKYNIFHATKSVLVKCIFNANLKIYFTLFKFMEMNINIFTTPVGQLI